MAFGWCTAHEQYVKLYHPAGAFFSQCQFKTLPRVRRLTGPPAPPENSPQR